MISKTGRINGRGSDPYKWVSGLSKKEREHVQNGGLVLVSDPLYGSNPHVTKYKKVQYHNGRYYHRNYNGV